MTEKSEIPCKDCITLAICKGQVGKETSYEDVVHSIIPKCILIQKFVTRTADVYDYYSTFQLEIVEEYLGSR